MRRGLCSGTMSVRLSVRLSVCPSYRPLRHSARRVCSCGPGGQKYRSIVAAARCRTAARRLAANAGSVTLSAGVWSWTQTGAGSYAVVGRCDELIVSVDLDPWLGIRRVLSVCWTSWSIPPRLRQRCVCQSYTTNHTDFVFVYLITETKDLRSVLWHCRLGVRKSIRPVKTEWRGVGVVVCLEWGANCLHMVQVMPKPYNLLPHLKPDWFHLSETGLPSRGCPGKEAVKWV